MSALKRFVPAWAQPSARRMLNAVRATIDWLGLTTPTEAAYRRRVISHAYPHGVPRLRTSFVPERTPSELDIDAASRVLDAWGEAVRADPGAPAHPVGDVWEGLAHQYHGDLIAILAKQDPRALAAYLCNMSRHGATVGITQGITEFRKASSSRHYREWGGFAVLDRLIALAEAVGVLRMENPEQEHWGKNIYEDIDSLIEKTEAALGIRIVLPEIEGCLFGLESKSGRLHFRDLTAVYAAWRIHSITNRSQAARICEIGGGTGRVAYYCARFGIADYAIYDLPLINMLQGYFLLRTLPEARIVLYGEDTPVGEGTIRVLPHWALAAAPAKAFDMVLNQDSFPEIDRAIVAGYLRAIKRCVSTHFLSINHETEAFIGASAIRHLVVADVVKEVGGFERVYRFPCWIRAGYAEELYRIS